MASQSSGPNLWRAVFDRDMFFGGKRYEKGTRLFVKDYNEVAWEQVCALADGPLQDQTFTISTEYLDIGVPDNQETKVIGDKSAASKAKIPDAWIKEQLPLLRKVGRGILVKWFHILDDFRRLKADPRCLGALENITKVEKLWWDGVPDEVRQIFSQPNPDLHHLRSWIVDTGLEDTPTIRTDIEPGQKVYLRRYEVPSRHSSREIEIFWYPGSAKDLRSRFESHRYVLKKGTNFGSTHTRVAKTAQRCTWKILWSSSDYSDGEYSSTITRICENLWICLLQSYDNLIAREQIQIRSSPLMPVQAHLLASAATEIFQRSGWTFAIGKGINFSSPLFENIKVRYPWIYLPHDDYILLHRCQSAVVNAYGTFELFSGKGVPFIGFTAQWDQKDKGLLPGTEVWITIQFTMKEDHHHPYARVGRVGPMSDSHISKRMGILLRWQWKGKWYKSWHQAHMIYHRPFEYARGHDEILAPVPYITTRVLMDVLLKRTYKEKHLLPSHITEIGVPILKVDYNWVKGIIEINEVKDPLVPTVELPQPRTIQANMAEMKEIFSFFAYGKRPPGFNRKLCDYHTLLGRAWDHRDGVCNGELGRCDATERFGLAPTWHTEDQLKQQDRELRSLRSFIFPSPEVKDVSEAMDPRFFPNDVFDAAEHVITDDAIDKAARKKTKQQAQEEPESELERRKKYGRKVDDHAKFVLEYPISFKKWPTRLLEWHANGWPTTTVDGLASRFKNAKEAHPNYWAHVQQIEKEQDAFLWACKEKYPLRGPGSRRNEVDWNLAAAAWNARGWIERTPKEVQKAAWAKVKNVQSKKLWLSKKKMVLGDVDPDTYVVEEDDDEEEEDEAEDVVEQPFSELSAPVPETGHRYVDTPLRSTAENMLPQRIDTRPADFDLDSIANRVTDIQLHSSGHWYARFSWNDSDTPLDRDWYNLEIFNHREEWRVLIRNGFRDRTNQIPYPKWVELWSRGQAGIGKDVKRPE